MRGSVPARAAWTLSCTVRTSSAPLQRHSERCATRPLRGTRVPAVRLGLLRAAAPGRRARPGPGLLWAARPGRRPAAGAATDPPPHQPPSTARYLGRRTGRPLRHTARRPPPGRGAAAPGRGRIRRGAAAVLTARPPSECRACGRLRPGDEFQQFLDPAGVRGSGRRRTLLRSSRPLPPVTLDLALHREALLMMTILTAGAGTRGRNRRSVRVRNRSRPPTGHGCGRSSGTTAGPHPVGGVRDRPLDGVPAARPGGRRRGDRGHPAGSHRHLIGPMNVPLRSADRRVQRLRPTGPWRGGECRGRWF